MKKEKIAELISTFFYIGKAPKMPGTLGTLAAIPFAFLLIKIGPLVHMFFVLVLTLIGVWAAEVYQSHKGGHDRQEIVFDEVLGFLITMTWMPATWQAFLIGFILFRFLDILKPWPISFLDKKVKGGFGVMADDIAAGIVANVVLNFLFTKTNLLGSQLLIL